MLRKCRYGALSALTVLLMFLQAGCNSGSSSSPVVPKVPLVIISDVHFTPFYDTTIFDDLVDSPVEEWADIFESSTVTDLSTWGQETNYPLLKKALDAASKNIGEGQAAVFPGDILAHHFPEKFFKLYGKEDQAALHSFVYKTVVFFATQIRTRFGNVPVMFTLGNNDSYAGDYQLVPGGAFLADTAEAFFDTFLLGSADRKTYLSTYSAGGYFVAEPPGAKVLFVCVNSILFSDKRTESCADAPENAPSIQLDWLEKVLAKAYADKKKVFMLTHIPAGMNIYDTVKTHMDVSGKISDADLFWKESCQSRFLEICRQYESVIEIIFSGHTHMDEYLLILDRHGNAYKPVVVTPAVSPQFGNNPAFKVMTLREEDWKPLDYSSINCDLTLSSPDFSTYYTFSEAYFTKAPLTESLVALFPKMATDGVARINYGRFYYSGNTDANIIDDITWPAYWCGVGKMDKGEYIECVNSY
jgi:sphingomyelin phosphodiesterase acid-like 3